CRSSGDFPHAHTAHFLLNRHKRMETFLRLWNALNSLPEIQGRRIDAYIILGKSIKEIAEAEGVHEESIRQSIKRGLERMKKLFDFFFLTHLELMKKCLGL
ncbi:sigma-70 region 4 domain-containing protein, partial [Bifidobacterium breve]